MGARVKRIEFYEESSGKSPFREWLKAINDGTTRKRIRSRLDRLADGNPGDHRVLSSEVCELRLHFGPGYRLYYNGSGREIVLLLVAGDKSTQSSDIEAAHRAWRDYRERKDRS